MVGQQLQAIHEDLPSFEQASRADNHQVVASPVIDSASANGYLRGAFANFVASASNVWTGLL